MKTWNKRSLEGVWEVSYKIDGVKAIIQNGQVKSRANKPLYNLAHIPDGEYEIFKDNWKTSISLVRTREGDPVDSQYVFSLVPIDNRLLIGNKTNPSAEDINLWFSAAIKNGYEGLILKQGDSILKVKSVETWDVPVIGIQPGKGKHEGRIGALLTTMGKVGTGFTDKEREAVYPEGTIIEVAAMELTPNGKFRHPRFIRVREDR